MGQTANIWDRYINPLGQIGVFTQSIRIKNKKKIKKKNVYSFFLLNKFIMNIPKTANTTTPRKLAKIPNPVLNLSA